MAHFITIKDNDDDGDDDDDGDIDANTDISAGISARCLPSLPPSSPRHPIFIPSLVLPILIPCHFTPSSSVLFSTFCRPICGRVQMQRSVQTVPLCSSNRASWPFPIDNLPFAFSLLPSSSSVNDARPNKPVCLLPPPPLLPPMTFRQLTSRYATASFPTDNPVPIIPPKVFDMNTPPVSPMALATTTTTTNAAA